MITIETIEAANDILGVFGLLAIVGTVLLVIDLRTERRFAQHIRRFGVWGASLVVLGATILSLIYSEVFGLIPCGLCWLERMMLFPQIVLLAVALKTKDALMPLYGIALSTVGLIISLYHHYLQMGGTEFIKCPSAGVGSDCAKRFFFEYGFMTFPLLSAVLFTFLIALYVYIRAVSEKN